MNTQDKNLHTDQKNKKYTFAQREGDDFSCIKLTEGKYKDVVYHYGKVGLFKLRFYLYCKLCVNYSFWSIKKIFSKDYQPYQIGFISKEQSKVRTFGKLQW